MLPAGWLEIEGVRFRSVIGVADHERLGPQELVVRLRLKVNFEKAAATDSIQDAVDYRTLTERVTAAGEASRFHLIEALAAHLVRVILDEFPGVEAARVEVEKPGALGAARTVRARTGGQRRRTPRTPRA
jgi:FolB domain-containing protein